ncbi:MAG: hypothetical protein JWO58_2422, partial [Chitinophagaceae bacterium]|nr:hypothetical protein [Chitinophagaceae bacterium]
KTTNIQLLNGLGIVVANWTNTSTKDLDISNLPDGIYFLIAENWYFKIIKK